MTISSHFIVNSFHRINQINKSCTSKGSVKLMKDKKLIPNKG